MASEKTDLLDLVEAAYRIEVPDAEWLTGLAAAARPRLDAGFGIAAFEYYLPEGSAPKIVQHVHLGIPERLNAIYHTVFEAMPPALRVLPFRLGPCITGSQLMGKKEDFRDEPNMKRFLHQFGMYDSIWITAAEPSGHGCGFHAGRPTIAWATPDEVERWGYVTAHLATAVRLRYFVKALSASGAESTPEAVLDPKGRVHLAKGRARSPKARGLLRQAVLALEASRGEMRRTNPDKALARRKPLIAGRWSLLDRVDVDGHRYIVARENEPKAAGPPRLTARERQVVAFAKLGHDNKVIAYELGIAPPTVRVLMGRAMKKMRAKSRDDLLRSFDDRRGPSDVFGAGPKLREAPPALRTARPTRGA